MLIKSVQRSRRDSNYKLDYYSWINACLVSPIFIFYVTNFRVLAWFSIYDRRVSSSIFIEYLTSLFPSLPSYKRSALCNSECCGGRLIVDCSNNPVIQSEIQVFFFYLKNFVCYGVKQIWKVWNRHNANKNVKMIRFGEVSFEMKIRSYLFCVRISNLLFVIKS